MTISGCILLCIIIALAAFAVNVAKKKKLAAEQKKTTGAGDCTDE